MNLNPALERRRRVAGLAARVGVALICTGVAVVGVGFNSWTAGGPDSHAYVTQADLLLAGRVTLPVPTLARAPWPNAPATFAPAGYAPAADERSVAPITGPGLPLLTAGAKLIAGHCAGFWPVPLTGALLVWATFATGRRLGSDGLGVGAAWLVATSPVFLAMIKSPMSDVPAAAFWAVATLFALTPARGHAAAAGAAAAVAILIRPNLVPLAAVLGAWMLLRPGGGTVRGRLAAGGAFAATAAAGCLGVAAVNHAAFGSPLASGYGSLGALFSPAYLGTNLARYTEWIAATQTPLALAGLAAIFLPVRALWRGPHAASRAALLAAMTVVLLAIYLLYLPFDAWWFLRFLLPAWPAMAVGTAAIVIAITSRLPRFGAAVGTIALAALGARGVQAAIAHDVFPAGEGERRYATVAKLVEGATDPSAAVLAGMHAGPVRYYAGRLTVRFDQLPEGWLVPSIEWLRRDGRRPYILIEDWEMPEFRRRFGGEGSVGRLELAPVLAYRAHRIGGTIYLFDLERPDGPTLSPPPVRDPKPRCVPPNPRWMDP